MGRAGEVCFHAISCTYNYQETLGSYQDDIAQHLSTGHSTTRGIDVTLLHFAGLEGILHSSRGLSHYFRPISGCTHTHTPARMCVCLRVYMCIYAYKNYIHNYMIMSYIKFYYTEYAFQFIQD